MALRTTIANADWKSPSESTDTCVAGIQLIREVAQIDGTVEASLLSTLNSSATVTDPYCDGTKYTGTYYVSDQESITQESGEFAGSITIRQKLTKVWTIATASDLPTKIRMEGKDVLNAFALEHTTENFLADQWLYLNPANLDVIEALSITAPSGYTEVKRRTDIEGKGDRTCTLSILWKKVTAVAWGGVADLTYYDDYGYLSVSSKGEKTKFTREWYCIQNSDMATAMTALITGTGNANALTGYIIMNVRVRDQQDGSLTLMQQQIQQVNNVGIGSVKYDDPLGLQPIPIGVNEVVFDDFTATGLASAVGALTPGTGTTDGYQTDLKENGLYRRTYRYLNPTYPNGVTSGTPAHKWQHSESGYNSIKRAGDRLQTLAPGIAATNIEAVVQKLRSTALDGTSVVVGVSTQLGSSGDVTANQTTAIENTAITTTDAYTLEVGMNTNGDYTLFKRWWPSVSVANAGILCAPGGVAVIPFTNSYGAFTHFRAEINYQMDTGLCDVYQTADGPGSNMWWYKQGHTEEYDEHAEFINGIAWMVLTQQMLTTSPTNALAFVNCTTPYDNIGSWLRLSPAPEGIQKGRIFYDKNAGLYDARRVLWLQTTTFTAGPTIT